jgi:hypothetical protein
VDARLSGRWWENEVAAVTEAHRQALLEVWGRHTQPELEQDLDGVMETIPDDVEYELHPLGDRVRPREAVRAMYARVLPTFFERIERHENRGMWLGESGLASEDVFDIRGADGEIRKMVCLTVCPIDLEQGVIRGERIYFSQDLAEIAAESLSPDFGEIEGVTSLYEPIRNR